MAIKGIIKTKEEIIKEYMNIEEDKLDGLFDKTTSITEAMGYEYKGNGVYLNQINKPVELNDTQLSQILFHFPDIRIEYTDYDYSPGVTEAFHKQDHLIEHDLFGIELNIRVWTLWSVDSATYTQPEEGFVKRTSVDIEIESIHFDDVPFEANDQQTEIIINHITNKLILY